MALEDAGAEGARDELDRELGRLVLLVEDRIDLHDLQRARETGLGDELHRQVRLAVGKTAAYGGADAGRDVRLEGVHVQADVDEAGAGDGRHRLANHAFHSKPVYVAHRVDLDVELRKKLGLGGIERAGGDEGDAV